MNTTTNKYSDSKCFSRNFYYVILIAILGIFCLLYGYELKTLEKTYSAKINSVLFFLLYFASIITLVLTDLFNSKKFIKYIFLFLGLFLLIFLSTITYVQNNHHYSVIGDKTTLSEVVFRNPLKYGYATIVEKEHGFDRLAFEVVRQDGVKYKISLIGNHKLNFKSEEELLKIVKVAKDMNLTPNQAIGMYQMEKVTEAVKKYFLDEKEKSLQLYLQKYLDLSEWFLSHNKGSIKVLDIAEL